MLNLYTLLVIIFLIKRKMCYNWVKIKNKRRMKEINSFVSPDLYHCKEKFYIRNEQFVAKTPLLYSKFAGSTSFVSGCGLAGSYLAPTWQPAGSHSSDILEVLCSPQPLKITWFQPRFDGSGCQPPAKAFIFLWSWAGCEEAASLCNLSVSKALFNLSIIDHSLLIMKIFFFFEPSTFQVEVPCCYVAFYYLLMYVM